MDDAEIRVAFRQLLEVIDYLQDYEVGICHRDINPNNVMIDLTPNEASRDVKVTLIDFNVAKRFIDPETGNPLLLMTNTGTARYQAPEMLAGQMSSYDEQVDLWSAGGVLYYMLTGGYHAFDGLVQADIESAILKGAYNRTLPAYLALSDSAKDLIAGLLTVDYDKRMNVHEALEHPWLN